MFYTDFVTNQILVADLDGNGSRPLMEDDLEVPGQSTQYVFYTLNTRGSRSEYTIRVLHTEY